MERRSEPVPRILFLCSRNSCRSQMAEGFGRALLAPRFECLSAGIERSQLDPRAIAVMAERGIDLHRQTSKSLADLGPSPAEALDLVVTVCSGAHEACPVLPGVRVLHAGFDDPPALAKSAATEAEALEHYRRVRDEISAFVESLPNHPVWNEKKIQG